MPTGGRYAFQTQLFFLFQRLEQMRDLAQPGMFSAGVVSDFLFAKDALFAAITLSRRGISALHADPCAVAAAGARARSGDLAASARRRPCWRAFASAALDMEQVISANYLERLVRRLCGVLPALSRRAGARRRHRVFQPGRAQRRLRAAARAAGRFQGAARSSSIRWSTGRSVDASRRITLPP